MTDGLDRDELINLLGQLGDESDQTALMAARTIHAKVTAAGQTWDELLVGPVVETEEPVPTDEDADDEEEEEAEGTDAAADTPLAKGPLPDDAESLRLIARLRDSANISEELRAELDDYKADIEAGDFTAEDRKYLRALYRRLKKA